MTDERNSRRDERLERLTRELPRSIDPPEDLWPGIRAQIAPARRVTWQRWQLAAAVLLVALSSFITWSLTRRQAVPAAPVVVVRDLEDIDQYARASEAMAVVLDAGGPGSAGSAAAGLSPETRELLQRNLRIIDSVIAECRTAIAADSSNTALRELLGQVERQRLDFLRQAARLPRS